MNLWRVMAGEIGYRKLSFALGCVSAAVAVCAITASIALLRGHDLRTEKLIEIKEAKTRAEMAKMEDDYRVIMKRMGYNVMILHRDQDVAELHALGYPSVTMPAAYAERLAVAALPTLNHLLPVLQKRGDEDALGGCMEAIKTSMFGPGMLGLVMLSTAL